MNIKTTDLITIWKINSLLCVITLGVAGVRQLIYNLSTLNFQLILFLLFISLYRLQKNENILQNSYK